MTKMEEETSTEKLLAQLIRVLGKESSAPSQTIRYGQWYEFTIGIGKDEVAYITLSEDALNAIHNG